MLSTALAVETFRILPEIWNILNGENALQQHIVPKIIIGGGGTPEFHSLKLVGRDWSKNSSGVGNLEMLFVKMFHPS